jgi:hypothetical protein
MSASAAAHARGSRTTWGSAALSFQQEFSEIGCAVAQRGGAAEPWRHLLRIAELEL